MEPSVARTMWPVVEPVHAVLYFAPELVELAEPYGLPAHGSTYFACRAAPLGRVDAATVTASFFGFSPARVARSVPSAWALISPADALALRRSVATAALRRLLGDTDVSRAAGLASAAAESADVGDRPLAAANAALTWTGDPHADLWQALTTLREHRGDGHVQALVGAGVRPLEAHVVRAAAGVAPADFLRASRGWTEDEWRSAEAGLRDRGLIAADGTLTAAGHDLRDSYEDETDRLALGPWERLGASRTADLHHELARVASAVVAGGGVPVERGLGSPWPPY